MKKLFSKKILIPISIAVIFSVGFLVFSQTALGEWIDFKDLPAAIKEAILQVIGQNSPQLPPSQQAEKYYVFIDKIGKVYQGQEAGNTEYGDVVGIYPYTDQYRPTQAELARYKIIVISLTRQEKGKLLKPVEEIDPTALPGQEVYKTIKARETKINLDKLNSVGQEQETDKAFILDNLIQK